MSATDYAAFIASKAVSAPATGFEPGELNPALFPFQAAIVRWALRRGKAAVWADAGFGKTLMQLEWARQVCAHTGGRVLILAPLAVSEQTAHREAPKFGVGVTLCRSQADVRDGINVTNYERLEHFDATAFAGVVLDESGILKSYSGATRIAITDAFGRTPYRLCCTATPAPNDFMELGTHAEFLGAMKRTEMLSMFFVHDGGATQDWRLKGHAEEDFWRWVCSWAVMVKKPSDIGFSDEGYVLPVLEIVEHLVESDTVALGVLFDFEPSSLDERRRARRASLEGRVAKAAELATSTADQWLLWCDLNEESERLTAAIPGAVEVTGSDTNESKARNLLAFASGEIRVLVSKPRIAGFGMNFQSCHRMAFVGLSDSYEAMYQAIRRCWRFGQIAPVDVHIITSTAEGAVLANVKRKEADAELIAARMVEHMSGLQSINVRGTSASKSDYAEDRARGKRWDLRLGDCVEVLREVPADSVGFSIFSPPFASLYTYSNSDRDMGNCTDHATFFAQFQFLVRELLRVTMPGRNLSFHCMNLPTSKVRDGVIGITDFRGQLIRAFCDAGWTYHSEVCIWKDPVTAMQRTKALGLLHKQLKKDSCMSRQGIPDYLVTMRKPGDNSAPVSHTNETFPVTEWQEYASPVWMDINPSDTLQRESARDDADERHICPLQLEVIRRALRLWSRENDLILSPFAGIGSEGYVALQEGRRFLGVELKRSYWQQARANMLAAESMAKTGSLFA